VHVRNKIFGQVERVVGLGVEADNSSAAVDFFITFVMTQTPSGTPCFRMLE
jgi:hypothetical protein